MKVRIGLGASASTPDDVRLILDSVGEFGFDSIWWPEVLTQPNIDPFIALTWAAALHPGLKLGATLLLPGRNMVRLAKQLASLDALSAGRLLVTFVPGLTQAPEVDAVGVPVADRPSVMEERCRYSSRSSSGSAGLHHVHSNSAVAWVTAGRAIDAEHFGVSIGFSHAPLSATARRRIEQRAGGQDVSRLVPVGLEELRALLSQFIAAGFSKFVVRPMVTPKSWTEELRALGDAVLDLQT